VGQCGAHQPCRADDVDVQDAVPLLICDVLHPTGGADAGVGDNHVEAAEPLSDLSYRLAHRGVVADVTGNLEDVLLRLGEWS
jgi:hypothetical protein